MEYGEPADSRTADKNYVQDPSRHTVACGGGHTDQMACEAVVAWRERIATDPWICKGHSYGAHRWEDHRPEGRCSNCDMLASEMPRLPYG